MEGETCIGPDPFVSLPPNDLAFVCDDRRQLAIQFLERKGRKASVEGLAASELIGQTVELVSSKKVKEEPEQTVIGPDGTFTGQVKLPKSERAVRKVRIKALVGQETSRNVKLTRRARIIKAGSKNGKTTLRGAVLTR